MRKELLFLFLMLSVQFSFAEVVLPGKSANISAFAFLPSALDELEKQGIFVLFDEKGRAVGFLENGSIKENISYGNLTVHALPNSSTVVGSFEVEEAVNSLARLRLEMGEELDKALLRELDYLEYLYYMNRYGSLEKYLVKRFGIRSREDAIKFLDSLRISEAADATDIFHALESREIGYTQYLELLEALRKITGEDLTPYLDEELVEEINRYIDRIEKEVAKKALEEVLKNLDKEELELIKELLKKNYKLIYRVARDYIRELARSGELEKVMKEIEESGASSEVQKALREAALRGLRELSRVNILEFLPKEVTYYLLAISFIALVLALRGVG